MNQILADLALNLVIKGIVTEAYEEAFDQNARDLFFRWIGGEEITNTRNISYGCWHNFCLLAGTYNTLALANDENIPKLPEKDYPLKKLWLTSAKKIEKEQAVRQEIKRIRTEYNARIQNAKKWQGSPYGEVQRLQSEMDSHIAYLKEQVFDTP